MVSHNADNHMSYGVLNQLQFLGHHQDSPKVLFIQEKYNTFKQWQVASGKKSKTALSHSQKITGALMRLSQSYLMLLEEGNG